MVGSNVLYLNETYAEELHRVSESKLQWEQLEGKSVLIAGATGLIGSYLIDLLMYRNQKMSRKMRIYALGRSEERARERFPEHFGKESFIFIEHDIINQLPTTYLFDYVICGAGNSFPQAFSSEPAGVMAANLIGARNMLEHARQGRAGRILYISSGEVYGEGDGRDFTEQYSGYVDTMNPRACYPSSKRAAETLCVSYGAQFQLDTVVARPCHVYGPTASLNDNRAYAQFLLQALSGKDIIMKSEGKQERSYCYVADCATALLTILLAGASGQAYNIANKDSIITIRSMAELIADACGRKIVVEPIAAPAPSGYSTVSRSVLNASKLEGLGWQALFSMEQGIRQTVSILMNKAI